MLKLEAEKPAWFNNTGWQVFLRAWPIMTAWLGLDKFEGSVKVVFDGKMENRVNGEHMPTKVAHNHVIHLNRRSVPRSIEVLGHELFHVRQEEAGEFKRDYKRKGIVWKGGFIHIRDVVLANALVGPHNSPWEAEAYDGMGPLFQHVRDTLKDPWLEKQIIKTGWKGVNDGGYDEPFGGDSETEA